ncbi:MAG: hypothetical protein ABIN58_03460 [candidate division WOR-3 bacterium]
MHAKTIAALSLIATIGLTLLPLLDLERGRLLLSPSLADLPLLTESALTYVGAFSVPTQVEGMGK